MLDTAITYDVTKSSGAPRILSLGSAVAISVAAIYEEVFAKVIHVEVKVENPSRQP
jgi:hypothetical protein